MLITKGEFEEAATTLGVNLDSPSERAVSRRLSKEIPQEADRRILLVKEIVNMFAGHDVSLWIREWGVWIECPELVRLVRSTHGIEGETINARYEHVASSKTGYLEALCCAMVMNLWDFILLSPSCRIAIHASHDEYVSLIAGSEDAENRFHDFSDRLDLRAFIGWEVSE